MEATELIDQLEATLIAAIGDDAFDLSLDDDSGAVELATDDWTLVLEAWPDGIGFLAIDDDPASSNETELRAAVEQIVGKSLGPLTEANANTGAALAAALRRTTDPVSNALASLISA